MDVYPLFKARFKSVDVDIMSEYREHGAFFQLGGYYCLEEGLKFYIFPEILGGGGLSPPAPWLRGPWNRWFGKLFRSLIIFTKKEYFEEFTLSDFV